MFGRARKEAAAALERHVNTFVGAGYRELERRAPLTARLRGDEKRGIELRMVPQGRVFGGSYVLEIATADPVLPPSSGLEGRGRGLVRLSRVSFHPAGDDATAHRLARQLGEDRRLQDALARVHFDRVRVTPDGRAAIRHVGGSVVWILFPPLVRPVPLVAAQAQATASALAAFSQAERGR
ncbi:MAG: DUF3156 family protein [Actinomycetota bacterium]|nr:DUF3156 family protein [Actinomycetota bacterium]